MIDNIFKKYIMTYLEVKFYSSKIKSFFFRIHLKFYPVEDNNLVNHVYKSCFFVRLVTAYW